jgi:hypothetical protein
MTTNIDLTPVLDLPAVDRLHPQPRVKLPEWDPSMGHIEGYYKNMPRGSRWIATCNYATSRGRVRPDDIAPIGEMTKAQVRAELEDRVWNADQDRGGDAARLLLQLIESTDDAVPGDVRRWLTADRESRPEVIAPWDPPREIRLHIYRKGWRPADVSRHNAKEV